MAQKSEPLSPQPDTYSVSNWQAELKDVITSKKHAILMSPPGRLKISKTHGSYQYAQILNSEKAVHLSKKKNIRLIKALAQKSYNRKVLPVLQEMAAITGSYLTASGKITDVYSKLTPQRQELITPVTLTDAQYAARWLSESWSAQPLSAGYKTQHGEIVRSKSECIIANLLAQHNVPYRYEYPLKLTSYWDGPDSHAQPRKITFHPDFYCLNLKTRHEIVFEHFGLLDDADYIRKLVMKLVCYCDNGFYPGDNLIFTYETNSRPLQIERVEALIQHFLK